VRLGKILNISFLIIHISGLLFIIPLNQSEGEAQNFCIGIAGKQRDVPCLSVTSFSAHTSGAGGLKFGRNNHHIGCSKFTNQILTSCLEAEILSSKLCSEFCYIETPLPFPF